MLTQIISWIIDMVFLKICLKIWMCLLFWKMCSISSLFCSLEKPPHAHSDQLLYCEPLLCWHPCHSHVPSCKPSRGHHRNVVLWRYTLSNITLFTGTCLWEKVKYYLRFSSVVCFRGEQKNKTQKWLSVHYSYIWIAQVIILGHLSVPRYLNPLPRTVFISQFTLNVIPQGLNYSKSSAFS